MARRFTARAACVLVAALLALAGEPAAGVEHRTPAYRNLQVLPEDASPSEVFRVMKLVTRALGTECRACHRSAERDFASDALALKVSARAMMQLEAARRPGLDWREPPDDLCIGCHRGSRRPPDPARDR